MLEYLTTLYVQVSEASKGNPVLAGVVSLWGLSVATYLLRSVPMKIFDFLKHQVTTSFTFTNAGESYMNQTRYNSLMAFLCQRVGKRFSRSLRLRTVTWGDKFRSKDLQSEIQPGNDVHFFFYKGRFFWYVRRSLESNATSVEKETVTIYTFGRNHAPFYTIFDDAIPRLPESKIRNFTFDGKDWQESGEVVKRPIETVITANGLKEQLIETMKLFLASEDWYVSRGISWKEAYLLHGPTGTGKSSLIRALASYFNMNICQIDLSSMSNNGLRRAFSSMPSNSICLVEDFDDVASVQRRDNLEEHKPKEKKEKTDDAAEAIHSLTKSLDFGFLTLSGVLNTIDGVNDLHGSMIFFTTNCIDKIDKALLRKGRMDFVHYVGWLGDKEIKEYISVVFPDYVLPENVVFEEIAGCDVYAAFKENRADPEAFIAALPKQPNVMGEIKRLFNVAMGSGPEAVESGSTNSADTARAFNRHQSL